MSEKIDELTTLINKLITEMAVSEALMGNKVEKTDHIQSLADMKEDLTKQITSLRLKYAAWGGGGGVVTSIITNLIIGG